LNFQEGGMSAIPRDGRAAGVGGNYGKAPGEQMENLVTLPAILTLSLSKGEAAQSRNLMVRQAHHEASRSDAFFSSYPGRPMDRARASSRGPALDPNSNLIRG
jgi:hypothetical protein